MDMQISELTREQEPSEPQVRTQIFLPREAGARQPPQDPPPEPPVPDLDEPTETTHQATRFTTSPPVRRTRRTWLLTTAAVLVVAGAGGGFLLSPYNTVVYPVDAARLRTQGQTLASAASAVVADLVAPSAQVARAPAPVKMPPPQRDLVAIPSSDAQLREILALRDRTPREPDVADRSSTSPATPPSSIPPATTAQAASPSPPAASPALVQIPAAGPPAIPATVAARQPDLPQPHALPPLAVLETGATPALPAVVTPVVTSAVAPPQAAPNITEAHANAAASPAVSPPNTTLTDLPLAPPPTAAPAPLSLSRPGEVIRAATELRPAPMTPPQQIEILNLVTQLAVVVRDMRAENAALKSRVESTADRFDTAVTDFERRLALAEAKGALSAAMEAAAAPTVPPTETAAASPTRPARAVPGAGSGVQIIPLSNTAAAGAAAAPRYRVAAASPGLAMLSLLDRSGGEGSQLQIAVGDQVPGYGRVTAIQQRGSAWIVQTDKGPDKGVIQ